MADDDSPVYKAIMDQKCMDALDRLERIHIAHFKLDHPAYAALATVREALERRDAIIAGLLDRDPEAYDKARALLSASPPDAPPRPADDPHSLVAKAIQPDGGGTK